MDRLTLDFGPHTILLYPTTQQAVLVWAHGLNVVALTCKELCMIGRQEQARRAQEKQS